METKKILAPTLVAIATLVMLTVGATYAYFTVSTTNNFGTKTITATTPDIGSVALASGSNLTMTLTAADMMDKGADTTYYASASGKTTSATTANIGTATVTGAGTFTCTYNLSITDNDNSLYDAFQSMSTKSTGQIVLTVNGTAYDFNTASLFPKNLTNLSLTGLKAGTPKNITAQLKLVNKTGVDQSALAGKTITLSFTVSNFSCTATA